MGSVSQEPLSSVKLYQLTEILDSSELPLQLLKSKTSTESAWSTEAVADDHPESQNNDTTAIGGDTTGISEQARAAAEYNTETQTKSLTCSDVSK
jgi:hypothetical protein